MLPFLKKARQTAGLITEIRKPDDSEKSEKDGLEIAMEDLCRAEEIKDYKAMSRAFRAAFEMLELEPHEEISHEESEEE